MFKYSNLVALLAMVVIGLVSCNDGDDGGSNEVTPEDIQVAFATSEVSVNENDTDPVSVKISLNAAAVADISAKIKVENGDGTEDSNYTLTPAPSDGIVSVDIAQGEKEATFSFAPVNNDQIDGDKQVNFTLTSVEGLKVLETATKFVVKIKDDETAKVEETDLFISEYAEASVGSHKYIEIYNPKSTSVDLSNYLIKGGNNGKGWQDDRELKLSGTLEAGAVYVISNESADDFILSKADVTLPFPSAVHHNGDDPIALFKSNGSGGYDLIDILGEENVDPGDGWSVAGVENATKDHTLVRKTAIFKGNTDWTVSAGTTAENSEWIVRDDQDWANLGVFGDEDAPVPSLEISETSFDFGEVNNGETSVSKSFTVSGTNVTEDVNVVAPTNYKLALSSSEEAIVSYVDEVMISDVSSAQTVFVVFQPESGLNGEKAGKIKISTVGASEEISLTGTEAGNDESGILAKTSFEVPSSVPGVKYTDTGDASVSHDLVNNTGEPVVDFTASGGEMGYNAKYEPVSGVTDGLVDGDFVGVTDYLNDVTAFTEGTQGYLLSDVDGKMIVEFDEVTVSTGVKVSLDVFLNDTGYETSNPEDAVRIYVKTNDSEVDIINSSGTDLNDFTGLTEGAWKNISATISGKTSVQLIVEFVCNSGSELIYLDNVLIQKAAIEL
ncbi:lamin tail domain-containing protein [Reichenbachiella versicolor]|uniref:lamin tail domain-containing protein n=1 Tax=Reichenbachiella versicolor TaxID=1821036 RepID=UPI0013A5B410|nr:lamin tail domain-containing protein [Reichenbachiella versicolor]